MNAEHITIHQRHDLYSGFPRVFTVTVFGRSITTTVTHEAWVVSEWIRQIRLDHSVRSHRLVVGLATPIEESHPVTALHLCVGRQCLIFQIVLPTTIPPSLRSFLSDVNITFVGVNTYLVSFRLWTRYNLSVSRLFELGLMRENVFASMEALATMASNVLQLDYIFLPGYLDRFNWARWLLTNYQIQQASVVAYLFFEIGVRRQAWTWDMISFAILAS